MSCGRRLSTVRRYVSWRRNDDGGDRGLFDGMDGCLVLWWDLNIYWWEDIL
jgi:hypothetical protein